MEHFIYRTEAMIRGLLFLTVLSTLIIINSRFTEIRSKFDIRVEKDYSVISGEADSSQKSKVVIGADVIAQIKALKIDNPQIVTIIVENLNSSAKYGKDENNLGHIDYNINNVNSGDYIPPLANYQKKIFSDKFRTKIEYIQQ